MRIALVSEGTYPFVVGGVSVWCDQLIRGMPQHDWQVVALTVDGAETPLWEQPPNLTTVRKIPLWDPRPLLTTYRQQQGLFRYYTFATVHHDRYGTRDGGVEPVALSVRELDTAELEDAAQTWQNLHLNYVAGEGAVASPVAPT